jgi:hypothetical protein
MMMTTIIMVMIMAETQLNGGKGNGENLIDECLSWKLIKNRNVSVRTSLLSL